MTAHHQDNRPASALLHIEEVEKIVCLSRSAIYARMQADGFPRPLKIGPRCVRWREAEVLAWIDNLPRTEARASARKGKMQ
nr:AlpA family phage regulatory protein [uncultured Acidocella sp.]